MRHNLLGILTFLLFASATRTKADDLRVYADTKETKQLLERYLKQEAYKAFERRQAAIDQLKSTEEIAARQVRLRRAFEERLGGFPKRTPLNAKVVGVINGDRYRIEKLIYESQPKHYVTASLYLPNSKGPHPAVVIPSGHSATGKAAGYNQQGALILAKHGIAALCYDPIGQGERSQILDKDGKPRFKSTTEHTLVGAACFLVGRNTATYRIWDGIRSIDYLVSRKDVDAKRIGVTGCSGGGTLSSYLMALDRRVACAAPSCYLTSLRRLIDTIGPQDAEQNVFGQIDIGLDHADYVTMRAPTPVLMLTATRDFFDIQGAWSTYREAKRTYTKLGHPERVSLIETDTGHGYPRSHREAMLRWMRRWLSNVDKAETEPELITQKVEALRCSPKGQVMLMPGARSVVDLNVELSESWKENRRAQWKNHKKALETVRSLADVRPLRELLKYRATDVGKLGRGTYAIEKHLIVTDPNITLPALLFRPPKVTGQPYLWLHGDGKHVDAQANGPIEKLVKAGHLVLAVDVRGVGEIGTKSTGIWGGSWDGFFLSYLLGKSVLGMRAQDVMISAHYLSNLDGRRKPVRVVAQGVMGPPVLHAAALEPDLFAHVELTGCLRSWSEFLTNPATPGQLINVVHGALKAYDLPDLVRAYGEKRVTVIDPIKIEKLSQR